VPESWSGSSGTCPKSTRHRFQKNKDGVRLVAYQHPGEFD
jgi:hypothetical protein